MVMNVTEVILHLIHKGLTANHKNDVWCAVDSCSIRWQNPNVFYEIGIAHSIGKTVILIANMSRIDEIPFDLRSDRLLLYSNPNDLSKKLSDVLKNIHYAEWKWKERTCKSISWENR